MRERNGLVDLDAMEAKWRATDRPGGTIARDDVLTLVAEVRHLREVAANALGAIAPCVVGWKEGEMPVWAETLADAVPDLRDVLGLGPFELGDLHEGGDRG